MSKHQHNSFDFDVGDNVRVRVRENGTRGNIVAKFESECVDILGGPMDTSSPRARLRLPWGRRKTVTIKPYEAEFEVIDSE